VEMRSRTYQRPRPPPFGIVVGQVIGPIILKHKQLDRIWGIDLVSSVPIWHHPCWERSV